MNLKHTPVLVLLFGFLCGCSQRQPASQEAGPKASTQELPTTKADQEDCLRAARQFLGPHAVVLTCGHRSDAAHLAAIAAIRVPGVKDDKRGTPISKLKILRRDRSQWKTKLNIDNVTTNSAGYVGIYSINDSDSYWYHRVTTTDQPDGLILYYMTRAGRDDECEVGLGIGWNPAVGRFQEIALGTEEFKPEVKNPKHFRSSPPSSPSSNQAAGC